MLEKYLKRHRPVITPRLVEKVGEVTTRLDGSTRITDLTKFGRRDETPEGLEEWAGAVRSLKPKERNQITQALNSLGRSGRAHTIDELRATPDDQLALARNIGQGPRLGLLRALFGVKEGQ